MINSWLLPKCSNCLFFYSRLVKSMGILDCCKTKRTMTWVSQVMKKLSLYVFGSSNLISTLTIPSSFRNLEGKKKTCSLSPSQVSLLLLMGGFHMKSVGSPTQRRLSLEMWIKHGSDHVSSNHSEINFPSEIPPIKCNAWAQPSVEINQKVVNVWLKRLGIFNTPIEGTRV